jgi:hypothetical protein
MENTIDIINLKDNSMEISQEIEIEETLSLDFHFTSCNQFEISLEQEELGC